MWLLGQLTVVCLVVLGICVAWAVCEAIMERFGDFLFNRRVKGFAARDSSQDYSWEELHRRYRAGLSVPTAAAERFALDPPE